MAAVAKSGRPSLATLEPGYEHQINGLRAGEAIAAGDFVYIKSDNSVWLATGAAANAAAKAVGIVFQAAAVDDGVSIYHGVVCHYGSGLTPNTPYYLSGATAGAIVDVASTGGTSPLAYSIDDTRIYILPLAGQGGGPTGATGATGPTGPTGPA